SAVEIDRENPSAIAIQRVPRCAAAAAARSGADATASPMYALSRARDAAALQVHPWLRPRKSLALPEAPNVAGRGWLDTRAPIGSALRVPRRRTARSAD